MDQNEQGLGILITTLDNQLSSVKKNTSYGSLSYFMDDPMRRYDFLDGVHHLADQMYNFWRANPHERAKAISRVHIRKAQYKKQVRRKITIDTQLIKNKENEIKQLREHIVALEMKLETIDVESDPIDYGGRMKEDMKQASLMTEYIEGRAQNLRLMYETEQKLRGKLSVELEELGQQSQTLRCELSTEIMNLNTQIHNLKVRVLNQVASLEDECKSDDELGNVHKICDPIVDMIMQDTQDMLRNRFTIVKDHLNTKAIYGELFRKKKDPMYMHDLESMSQSTHSESDRSMYDIGGDDFDD